MNPGVVTKTTDLVFFSFAVVIAASIALKPRQALTAMFGRRAMAKVSRDREQVLQGLAAIVAITLGWSMLAHFLW